MSLAVTGRTRCNTTLCAKKCIHSTSTFEMLNILVWRNLKISDVVRDECSLKDAHILRSIHNEMFVQYVKHEHGSEPWRAITVGVDVF